MSKKKDIHVVPRADGGWVTKRSGAGRASDRHETQKDAIDAGRVYFKTPIKSKG